jgi:hypothetical protein
MKTLWIAAALAACVLPATANVVGVAESEGTSILLHDVKGPCVGDAQFAEFIAVQGLKVPGCWMLRGKLVSIVFLDGDVAAVPVAVLKPPKSV